MLMTKNAWQRILRLYGIIFSLTNIYIHKHTWLWIKVLKYEEFRHQNREADRLHKRGDSSVLCFPGNSNTFTCAMIARGILYGVFYFFFFSPAFFLFLSACTASLLKDLSSLFLNFLSYIWYSSFLMKK